MSATDACTRRYGPTNIVFEPLGRWAVCDGSTIHRPCRVDDDIDRAKGGRRPFEQSLDARVGCDVGRHGEDLSAFGNGLDGFGGFVEQRFISTNENDAFCSRLGPGSCDLLSFESVLEGRAKCVRVIACTPKTTGSSSDQDRFPSCLQLRVLGVDGRVDFTA
jgi:hypothetical protein